MAFAPPASPDTQAAIADFEAALSNLGQYPAADIIEMLTGFAVDLSAQAAKVISVLLTRLKSVDITRKVPLLYLLDSIVKRQRNSYAPPLVQSVPVFFLEMFSAVGDKDKLRSRKVLKGWRLERLVPPNVLDPVWIQVQGWCDANPNRVRVAEGKRPLPQGQIQQPSHQEQQLRALLYHEQVRMGLKPLSLEELRATNPGLIQVLQQAAAAQQQQQRQLQPQQQMPPNYVQQPPISQPNFLHQQQPLQAGPLHPQHQMQRQPVGSYMPAPVIPGAPIQNQGIAHGMLPQQQMPPQQQNQPPLPPPPQHQQHQQHVAPPQLTHTAAETPSLKSKPKEEDDQASELLAMLGGDFGDDDSMDANDENGSSHEHPSDSSVAGGADPKSPSTGTSASTNSEEPASPEGNDVNSLFAILQGVSGGTTPGGTLPSGRLRKFPLTVSLSQAFQGTTSQVQSALALRDEGLVQALHSGWQDKRSGARYNTKQDYEDAITFNYHITQRQKSVSGASLMRRWYEPWNSWVVRGSPYHVPGNQHRSEPVGEKLRDPFMTEEEAKRMSSNGGMDVQASASGDQGGMSVGTGSSLSIGGGGEGVASIAGEASAEANQKNPIGGKGSNTGADSIAMNQVGEDEGTVCIVCHESFESEFDDASDEWVYKNIRRVPAGLLHATCWSEEAAALPSSASGVSGKKRPLDTSESDDPGSKRAKKE